LTHAGLVDVHTHLVPKTIGAFGKRGGTLPGLVVESAHCGCLYRGDKLDRRIDERTWDSHRRVADMDERYVLFQVLSPVPVMFAYDCALDDTVDIVRETNDGIAAVVRSRPDRFCGLAGVPLQDVDAACDEAQRAFGELGLRGIEIGTGAGGRDLDDPAFDPLWQLISERDAVVFIHPDERAPGFDRLHAPGLVPAAGYPTETGITAAKMISSGFLARFPRLRFVLAHGGGTLPWLLPRMDRVWSRNPASREVSDSAPSVLAKRFWYDTLTYDESNLLTLIERAGADRLMIGSDYPFTIAEDPPGDIIAGSTRIADLDRRAIQHTNAVELFGLERHIPSSSSR
jgi:aminocarboxymuconate-semialdehyde decarboxylase